jgi:hypothetical protein
VAESQSGVAIALELLDFAKKMRAERHRRDHPEATDDEVNEVVRLWTMERPGAPFGDAEGRSVSWPRPGRQR